MQAGGQSAGERTRPRVPTARPADLSRPATRTLPRRRRRVRPDCLGRLRPAAPIPRRPADLAAGTGTAPRRAAWGGRPPSSPAAGRDQRADSVLPTAQQLYCRWAGRSSARPDAARSSRASLPPSSGAGDDRPAVAGGRGPRPRCTSRAPRHRPGMSAIDRGIEHARFWRTRPASRRCPRLAGARLNIVNYALPGAGAAGSRGHAH